MKKSFFAFFQIGRYTGLLIHLSQEAKRCRICLVNACSFFEGSSRLVPFVILHLDQCQKMISLDQFRILRQDPAKLDRRHIFMSFTTQHQRIVVFPDCFIDRIQTVSVGLKLIDIFRCKISGWLQILTDDPFTECGNHFSRLKIHKSKKVSRFDVSFIIDQTLFQTCNCTGKITNTCFFQPLIIKTL